MTTIPAPQKIIDPTFAACILHSNCCGMMARENFFQLKLEAIGPVSEAGSCSRWQSCTGEILGVSKAVTNLPGKKVGNYRAAWDKAEGSSSSVSK